MIVTRELCALFREVRYWLSCTSDQRRLGEDAPEIIFVACFSLLIWVSSLRGLSFDEFTVFFFLNSLNATMLVNNVSAGTVGTN